jgi:hypothetical protein
LIAKINHLIDLLDLVVLSVKEKIHALMLIVEMTTSVLFMIELLITEMMESVVHLVW